LGLIALLRLARLVGLSSFPLGVVFHFKFLVPSNERWVPKDVTTALWIRSPYSFNKALQHCVPKSFITVVVLKGKQLTDTSWLRRAIGNRTNDVREYGKALLVTVENVLG
jgi:hypothetical protein